MLVADDRFFDGIPLDRAIETRGDDAQMTRVHRLRVGPNVGDGLPPFADATQEIFLVPFEGKSVVELCVIVFVKLVGDTVFDDLSGDALTVDEESTFRTFKQNPDAVFRFADDAHFESGGEGHADIEP